MCFMSPRMWHVPFDGKPSSPRSAVSALISSLHQRQQWGLNVLSVRKTLACAI